MVVPSYLSLTLIGVQIKNGHKHKLFWGYFVMRPHIPAEQYFGQRPITSTRKLRFFVFFIGPESDHRLCLSFTDSLTDSLMFSKLD